jgi:hypothetical protein
LCISDRVKGLSCRKTASVFDGLIDGFCERTFGIYDLSVFIHEIWDVGHIQGSED